MHCREPSRSRILRQEERKQHWYGNDQRCGPQCPQGDARTHCQIVLLPCCYLPQRAHGRDDIDDKGRQKTGDQNTHSYLLLDEKSCCTYQCVSEGRKGQHDQNGDQEKSQWYQSDQRAARRFVRRWPSSPLLRSSEL